MGFMCLRIPLPLTAGGGGFVWVAVDVVGGSTVV